MHWVSQIWLNITEQMNWRDTHSHGMGCQKELTESHTPRSVYAVLSMLSLFWFTAKIQLKCSWYFDASISLDIPCRNKLSSFLPCSCIFFQTSTSSIEMIEFAFGKSLGFLTLAWAGLSRACVYEHQQALLPYTLWEWVNKLLLHTNICIRFLFWN